MRKSFFLLVTLFVFFGCKKPKATDKPTLEFKSVNTTEVSPNGLLRFTFTFTSGAAVDSIYVMKSVPDCEDSEFDQYYPLPEYPTSVGNGTLEINFINGFIDGYSDLISPQCGDPDTAIFKFVLTDVNSKTSDTVVSPKIVIL